MESATVCGNPECGKLLPPYAGGQHRKFCSHTCSRRVDYLRFIAAGKVRKGRGRVSYDMRVEIQYLPAWVMPGAPPQREGRLVRLSSEE